VAIGRDIVVVPDEGCWLF